MAELGPWFSSCLLSKCYNAARDIVDEDIYDVDPHRTGMTPTDFFLYCYYGGMICVGECRS